MSKKLECAEPGSVKTNIDEEAESITIEIQFIKGDSYFAENSDKIHDEIHAHIADYFNKTLAEAGYECVN